MAKAKDVEDVAAEAVVAPVVEVAAEKSSNPVATAIREVVAGLRLFGGLNDKSLESQFRAVADHLESRATEIEKE